MKNVKIIFDSVEYLYHLVGEQSVYLYCELIRSPQDTGDFFFFRYKSLEFRVNPNFSGFVGLVELDG